MSILENFPHFLHGGDYNPDQWLHQPEVINEDFRLVKLAGCNTFSLCIFSWSQLEPEEGVFTFEWLDEIMDRMAAEGHNVFLSTPTGGKPLWMSEKYEDVRMVLADGRRERSCERHNFCWSSPTYHLKTRIMNEKLAERYAKHPALKMWHISNELGGHHKRSDCYCDYCMEGFYRFLREKYKDLATLNRAYWSGFWSHRYSKWEHVDPRDGTIHAALIDWRRYCAQQVADWVAWEAKAIRRYSNAPLTINHMSCHWKTNYQLIRQHIDIVSNDDYPNYTDDLPDLVRRAVSTSWDFDYVRCVGSEPKVWFAMESAVSGMHGPKRDGVHALEMLQNVAHGADGTLFFQVRKGRGGAEQFHPALIHHTGGEHTRVFKEVQKWASRLPQLEPVLGSLNAPEVGLLHDYDSEWATLESDFVRCVRDLDLKATYAYPRFYHQHLQHWSRPLWNRGIGKDIISYQTADWDRYKLIFAPIAYVVDEERVKRMKDYVESGGNLVLTYHSGMVDPCGLSLNDGCPGCGLDELTGTWIEDHEHLKSISRHAKSTTKLPGLQDKLETKFITAHVHARDAEVFATLTDGVFPGQPLLTRKLHPSGGSTWYLGAMLTPESLDSVVEAICRASGLQSSWLPDCERLPEGVTVQTRVGEKERFHFVLNFSPESHEIATAGRILNDLETGESLSVIKLEPWQGKVIVEAKSV